MSEQNTHTAEIIGNITKFFGWIAGVIAGISALLSVAGFMLLQAHAHLLGVSGVLHHTVQEYLYQGGNFLITTLFWAVPVSIIRNKYVWIVAGIIAVYLLGKRLGWIRDLPQRLELKEGIKQPWVWGVVMIAAAILFIFFINHILPSEQTKDLLFPIGSRAEIAKRATPEALETLQGEYTLSVLYVLLSTLILLGIKRIHQFPTIKTSSAILYLANRFSSKPTMYHVDEETRGNKGDLLFAIGLLFLYLLFVVQVALLPVQYGKTVYPNTFHKVSNLILDEKFQGKIPQSGNIYLINERGDEMVFYFGDTQEISLVKKDHVLNLIFKAQKNIFEK